MSTEITQWTRKRDGKTPIGTCDRCGKTFPLNQLKEEWSGLTVCDSPHSKCFEIKHESLSFKVKPDHSLAWPSPKMPRDTGEVDPDFDVEADLRARTPWG